MEDLNFKKCGTLLLRGNMMLLVLLFKKHTFKTLFAISFIINLFLGFAVGKAHAERDNRDSVAYMMEQKVDSLNIIMGKE